MLYLAGDIIHAQLNARHNQMKWKYIYVSSISCYGFIIIWVKQTV